MHCGVEELEVAVAAPGSVVQQVDLLCASADLMVADLIGQPVGIDQLNGLRLPKETRNN